MTSRFDFRFDEETHCYYCGDRIVPGVNEILGAWKRIKIKEGQYHVNTFNGATIPSFVMFRCAKTGSLIHDKCAKLTRGCALDDVLAELVSDPSLTEPEVEKIGAAVQQYRLFLDLFNVEPLIIEGSYYSEKYDYAGTLDLFAKISGDECRKIFGKSSTFCVSDTKTGKLSWTAAPQLAAYKQLLEESKDWPKGLNPAEVPRMVLSLPRDGGAFSVVPMNNPKDKTFFLARRWERQYRDEIIEACKKKAG